MAKPLLSRDEKSWIRFFPDFFSRIRFDFWRIRFFHATRNRGSASFPIAFSQIRFFHGARNRGSASFPMLLFSRIRFDLWRSRFFHATRNRGSASFPVLLFRKSALTCGEAASFTRREIVDPLLSRFCFVANPLLSLRTYIQWRCVGILYTSIYIYIYTYSLHCGAFFGFITTFMLRILKGNPKKELQWRP